MTSLLRYATLLSLLAAHSITDTTHSPSDILITICRCVSTLRRQVRQQSLHSE